MNDLANKVLQINLTGAGEEIAHLASELEQFCERESLGDLVKNQVNLVLEELYTNASSYGFEGIENGQVKITLAVINHQLEICFEDNGIAFDPLEISDPDLMLSLDDRPIGGLGVFFVKTLTDHVEYQRVGDFNQIKMMKRLLPA
jgi:serine/threonine-protein kinase RsbW